MSRPGLSIGNPIRTQTILLSALCGSALAAFTAATWKFLMPQAGQVVGVTLNVNQRGGTHATSTIDVKAGANSLLAAVFDVAALTPATPVNKEGASLSASALSVAKDAAMSVVVAVAGGSSPTWADVTVQIDYIPTGD